METGIGTATKAAEGIIAADPVLGGISVILAIALVAVMALGWRALSKKDDKNDALYDRLIATEQKHQLDIKLVNDQRSEEIATLAKFRDLLTARGK